MRFLCLHGWGTNSDIFEAQTALLRHEIGGGHTYEFVDGPMTWPTQPGIEEAFGEQECCYTYWDPSNAASIEAAVDYLEEFMNSDGPFDGVLAFSQGAALAATLLAKNVKASNGKYLKHPLFKCAIFLSAMRPVDYSALASGEIRMLSRAQDGVIYTIPTSNIWGAKDSQYPGVPEQVSDLCLAEQSTTFVHSKGHEVPMVPGDDLASMVAAIKKIIGLVQD
ncbi:MAG: hypothetical protein Q9162_007221 [Coniocarpon cinnabarinum]